jgi:uncharacterized protein YaiI (UPF0178 family)
MAKKIEEESWVVIDRGGKIYKYKNLKKALKHKDSHKTMTEQYFEDHYKQDFLSF